MRDYCRHGNFIGKCHYCVDELRKKAGRLTLQRYELDQEYKALCKERDIPADETITRF